MENAKLKVYKMYADVPNLFHGTSESVCYDVHAYFGKDCRLITTYGLDNTEYQSLACQETSDGKINTIIYPGHRMLIPTGLILDIPVGYSVRLHPRSGKALKSGISLCNAEGVIDSDYVDPCYIAVVNLSGSRVRIEHEERIAQLELVKRPDYNIEYTDIKPEVKTNRVGGFGSTGKN